ncbi:MAG: hypothetical protein H0W58_10820 [Acidobacteria bacterium]|jgi:hypothetical protein|nr:hypothetical protein [Acidobacteriota bacterium]
MKNFREKFAFCFLLLLVSAVSAAAQFQDEGKLNAWTTRIVQRKHESETVAESLCKIRVAKQKGFDRIVFEFDKGKPEYIIQYLPSNIYSSDAGDEEIKIAGKVFMQVSLYGMPQMEDLPCKLESYPKGKLKLRAVQQIDEEVWFEGIRDFLIGVKVKKPFRVQELTNPSRLVIDFKH